MNKWKHEWFSKLFPDDTFKYLRKKISYILRLQSGLHQTAAFYCVKTNQTSECLLLILLWTTSWSSWMIFFHSFQECRMPENSLNGAPRRVFEQFMLKTTSQWQSNFYKKWTINIFHAMDSSLWTKNAIMALWKVGNPFGLDDWTNVMRVSDWLSALPVVCFGRFFWETVVFFFANLMVCVHVSERNCEEKQRIESAFFQM